jgi:protein-S-isoprenylcysteine O-methyltransferase Ste14
MEKLLSRTLSDLLKLLVLLAAAMFIPAATLDFWQGWAFLVMFAMGILLIAHDLYKHDRQILEDRFRTDAALETHKTQRLIRGAGKLAFFGMFVAAGFDRHFGWSSIPIWVSLAAEAGVVFGMFIVLLVFQEKTMARTHGKADQGQAGTSRGRTHQLRRPSYSGAGVLVLVIPLALGSWAAFPFALLLIGVIIARLMHEEKVMRGEIQEHETYHQHVHDSLGTAKNTVCTAAPAPVSSAGAGVLFFNRDAGEGM